MPVFSYVHFVKKKKRRRISEVSQKSVCVFSTSEWTLKMWISILKSWELVIFLTCSVFVILLKVLLIEIFNQF